MKRLIVLALGVAVGWCVVRVILQKQHQSDSFWNHISRKHEFENKNVESNLSVVLDDMSWDDTDH